MLQTDDRHNTVAEARPLVRSAKKWLSTYESSNISETQQDITKITIEDQQKVIRICTIDRCQN